jgi:Zn-dependent protease with chaperone function
VSALRSGRLVAVLPLLLLLCGRATAQVYDKTDPATEIKLGRQIARVVERQTPLCADQTLVRRVSRIGAALLDRLGDRSYTYEFRVLASSDANAFSVPGGIIYVTEGLLAALPDDDGLAFVLAHELAHAALRHWAKQTEKTQLIDAAITVGSTLIGGDRIFSILTDVANFLITLRYSRDCEDAADETGLRYLWQSGFDVDGGIAGLRAAGALESASLIPRYFRDHPLPEDRVGRLQGLAEELKAKPPPATGPTTAQALTSTAAIAGDLSGIQIAPNPYCPLAAGREWRYEVKAAGVTSEYTVSVTGALTTPAGEVYGVETRLSGAATVSSQLLTTAAEVWRRATSGPGGGKWQVEYPTSPPASGAVSFDGWEYRLVGVEAVSVPCGAFADALHLRRSRAQPAATYDLWLVRDVGLVKRTCLETKVTEALARYTAAPPAPGG